MNVDKKILICDVAASQAKHVLGTGRKSLALEPDIQIQPFRFSQKGHYDSIDLGPSSKGLPGYCSRSSTSMNLRRAPLKFRKAG